VLRSHNSGNSQLGILALHLVKEAAERKVSAVHQFGVPSPFRRMRAA